MSCRIATICSAPEAEGGEAAAHVGLFGGGLWDAGARTPTGTARVHSLSMVSY